MIQLKYSMSLKNSMEDKHATIYFSMLKDHMVLQNAKVPYSYSMVLVQKDVHRCWLSQECQDMLLRSLPLTSYTPCTRESVTQDFLHGCRTSSRKPWHTQWALGIQQDVTQLQHTQPALGSPAAPTLQAVQEQQVWCFHMWTNKKRSLLSMLLPPTQKWMMPTCYTQHQYR